MLELKFCFIHQAYEASGCWIGNSTGLLGEAHKVFKELPPALHPLHLAAQHGHKMVVEVLLESRASVDTSDPLGFPQGAPQGVPRKPCMLM